MSSRRVDAAPGVSVACTVTGQGPALLLMHGAEADHRMFDALVPHLSDAFTVIAYDQRECGGTEAPADPVGLAALADDAQGLLAALGHVRAHVFGSSFGGRVAQMLAHRHPGAVDSLVLGSTWALPDRLDTANPLIADIQALRAQLPESAEALAGYFLPQLFLQDHPEHRGLFRGAAPQTDRGRRRAMAVADVPDVAPECIAARCLVLAGGADRVVPAALTLALAARLPSARAVLMDGVGHATVIQDPARVAREIREFCLGACE